MLQTRKRTQAPGHPRRWSDPPRRCPGHACGHGFFKGACLCLLRCPGRQRSTRCVRNSGSGSSEILGPPPLASRAQEVPGPAGVPGHPVRPAHRDRLGTSAAVTRLRLRDDLLAPPGPVDRGWSLAPAAQGPPGRASQPNALDFSQAAVDGSPCSNCCNASADVWSVCSTASTREIPNSSTAAQVLDSATPQEPDANRQAQK